MSSQVSRAMAISICMFASILVGCQPTDIEKATADAASVNMLRIETAYVEHDEDDLSCEMLICDAQFAVDRASILAGNNDRRVVTWALVKGLETVPPIKFRAADGADAALNPTAKASKSEVDYWVGDDAYVLGSSSASGTTFAVTVDLGTPDSLTMYVNGKPLSWLELSADDGRSQSRVPAADDVCARVWVSPTLQVGG